MSSNGPAVENIFTLFLSSGPAIGIKLTVTQGDFEKKLIAPETKTLRLEGIDEIGEPVFVQVKKDAILAYVCKQAHDRKVLRAPKLHQGM